jgi:hypothetical protein
MATRHHCERMGAIVANLKIGLALFQPDRAPASVRGHTQHGVGVHFDFRAIAQRKRFAFTDSGRINLLWRRFEIDRRARANSGYNGDSGGDFGERQFSRRRKQSTAPAGALERAQAMGAVPGRFHPDIGDAVCGGLREPCVERCLIFFAPILAAAALQPFGGAQIDVFRTRKRHAFAGGAHDVPPSGSP